MLPATVAALLLFLATLPDLSDPLGNYPGMRRAAILLFAATAVYGVAEVSLCAIRRCLLHPAVAFLLLVLGLATSISLLSASKRSADTTIIPELRLSSPEPSP